MITGLFSPQLAFPWEPKALQIPAGWHEPFAFTQDGFGGREAQHGRHRLVGSRAVSAAFTKRGERTYADLNAKPSLWEQLSSGGSKTEARTALCGSEMMEMASTGSHGTFKLFSSLTLFLLLDVLISCNVYTVTCGQVNRLFWIKQLC